jgi:hypothetical protein
MTSEQVFTLVVIIGVIAIIPLLTGVWGLFFAIKESLRRNSTRGFFGNVGEKMRGGLWGVLATLPLITIVYVLACAIVSIRLLGAEPGVTVRHVRGMLIGAVLAPIVVGCASAFVILPLMNLSGNPGEFQAKGLGGLYWFFSNWWVPSLVALPVGAVIGLSRVDKATPASE